MVTKPEHLVVRKHNMGIHRDFLEGSFVVGIADDTGDPTGEGQVYVTKTGRFQLIGNWCHFSIDLRTSDFGTLTGSQQAVITGLPFTIKAISGFDVPCKITATALNLATAGDVLSGRLRQGTATILIEEWTLATGVSACLLDTLSADMDMKISGCYEIEPIT